MKRLAILLATLAVPTATAAAPVDIAARIVRDDWGVPHIFADHEEDAMFAVGYAQAEDRLVEILIKYKYILAESSTLPADIGQSAADARRSDMAVRQGRYIDRAGVAWAKLSPQVRKDYAYFVAGVQRYMAEHPDKVPAWAPRLSPLLPIAAAFEQQYGDAIDMGLRDCERSGLSPENRIPRDHQSNAWAVAPSRTRDGKAILAFDPHGNFGRPEYSIHAAGINAYVGTDIGNFYPFYGHNDAFAWGATSGSPDVADCYLVETDPADPRRYRFDGRWQTMKTVSSQITARDGKRETVRFDYTAHNGFDSPVVGRNGTLAYVVSSPAVDAMADFTEAYHRLFRTRTIAGFRDDLKLLGMSPYEYVTADTQGGIFFVGNGRVPIRPPGYNFAFAVPGNISATAWRGIHPSTALPQIANPSSGWLQANNTYSEFVTDDSGLTFARLPVEMVHADDPEKGHFNNTRSLRITQLLRGLKRATFDDMVALSNDQLWPVAKRWQGALEQALSAQPDWLAKQPADVRAIVASLRGFDGQAHQESVAAAHYYFWRMTMAKDAAIDPYALGTMMLRVQQYGEPLTALEQRVLLEGIVKGRDEMVKRRGGSDRPLGDFFRIGRGGQSYPIGGIEIQPLGAAGSTDSKPAPALFASAPKERPTAADAPITPTLNFVGGQPNLPYVGEQDIRVSMPTSGPDANGQVFITDGPKSAFVIELSTPVRSVSAISFGVSADPASPHYADQAKLVSERRFKPNRFTEADIAAHATRRKELVLRADIAIDLTMGMHQR